jgi:hypothetical protein
MIFWGEFVSSNISEEKKDTVKPVYNSHSWDQKKVVVVPRWSLFRRSKCKNIKKFILKIPLKTKGGLGAHASLPY